MQKCVLSFVFLTGLMLYLTGCDNSTITVSSPPVISSPPISVTMRASLLADGGVLQVHNLDAKRLSCTLFASYPKTRETVDYEFILEPNKTKEIGILECNWGFAEGGSGWIKVQGYGRKLNFEILPSNRVSSNFSF